MPPAYFQEPPFESDCADDFMVRQEGFEPPAYCLEGSCSIQLSYWRIGNPCWGVPREIPHRDAWKNGAGDGNRTHVFSLEG